MIRGIQKFTLIDFPEKVACTVFLGGCNFRCVYCHNPELVIPPFPPKVPEEYFFDFLESRKGKLDGVVICGGEPTIHPNLPEFIRKIKERGFAVKLDTNGYNVRMIKRLIEENLLDYIAMDVKAPLEKYEEIVGVKIEKERIVEAIKIIMDSGVKYEFRTTAYPSLGLKDYEKIGELIEGARLHVIQQYSNQRTLSGERVPPLPKEFLFKAREVMLKYVKECEVVNL